MRHNFGDIELTQYVESRFPSVSGRPAHEIEDSIRRAIENYVSHERVVHEQSSCGKIVRVDSSKHYFRDEVLWVMYLCELSGDRLRVITCFRQKRPRVINEFGRRKLADKNEYQKYQRRARGGSKH